MTTSRQPNDHCCVFQAENAIWAVAATSVREIADATTIVIVPEAPAEIVGVCHLRMEFVPVLSLHGLLGEASPDHHSAEYLLILDGREGPWALPIQRALSLHSLEIAVGETAGDAFLQSSGILGTATFRDEVLQIVDAAWLYRRATDVLDSHWNGPLKQIKRHPQPMAAAPIQ